MKTVNFIIFFLVISLVAYSQKASKPKPPKVEKAKTLLDDNKLSEAKNEIDYALIYDKTKDKAKTNYYAGLIYEKIFNLQDSGMIETLDPEAYDKCIKAYKKVKTLENEYGTYYNFAELRLNTIYSRVFNSAAREYQNEEFDSALLNFDRASLIMDHDTAAITYAGYAAQQSEKYDVALKHFNYLVDHNMADVLIFRDIIYIERSINNDTTAALNVIEKARKVFPEDHDLKQDEITLMILTHQIEKAEKQLMDAIQKDPENYLYYYELAYIYDNADDYDNAVKYYQKCLDLKPEYFDANYNLGVKHYNEGAIIAKKANFMSVEEYQKSGKAVEDSAAVFFRKALPYFEKCYKLQPSDISTVQTLVALYGQLKMKDKAEEMTKVMDSLSTTGGSKE